MRLYLSVLAFLLFPASIFAVSVSDRIEMGVSPIRTEVTVAPGVLTTKTITFFNNSNEDYNIYLTVEDCEADSQVGTPKCSLPPNPNLSTRYFSTWVTFDGPTSFVVPAKSERLVTVNIKPPANPIPGGRYGAVFFNSPSGTPGSNSVNMIRRIGSLFLVTVPGQITYDTNYGQILIGPGGGGGGGGGYNSIDPLYSSAPKTPEEWIRQIRDLLNPSLTPPTLPTENNFDMDFTIPVKNGGNIHVLPVGRIELLDENDVPLKNIGKESIRSPEGVFIGEKIVDYLPINDEAGNVLPNSERIYTVSWKGFAYETFDGGKSVIKYLTPQEYYKQGQMASSPYLLPWEKFRVVPVKKIVKAKIYLEYMGENGVPVPYELEKDINLSYQSLEKGINYGALLIILLLLIILWIIVSLMKKSPEKTIVQSKKSIKDSEELDELEKGKLMAKLALEKKASKTPPAKKQKEVPGVSLEADQKEIATKKPRVATPRKKKTEDQQ